MFTPVTVFIRRLVRSTLVIIFVVYFAAVFLARSFVRPIRRLETGSQQISVSGFNVTLPTQSRDEFGDLTVAFNDMSCNLSFKDELLTIQRKEIDRLMLSLLPEPMVQRYREGEETVRTLNRGDFVGQNTLMREPARINTTAIQDVTAVQIDRDYIEDLGLRKPLLLHNISGVIAHRRSDIRQALIAHHD